MSAPPPFGVSRCHRSCVTARRAKYAWVESVAFGPTRRCTANFWLAGLSVDLAGAPAILAKEDHVSLYFELESVFAFSFIKFGFPCKQAIVIPLVANFTACEQCGSAYHLRSLLFTFVLVGSAEGPCTAREEGSCSGAAST